MTMPSLYKFSFFLTFFGAVIPSAMGADGITCEGTTGEGYTSALSKGVHCFHEGIDELDESKIIKAEAFLVEATRNFGSLQEESTANYYMAQVHCHSLQEILQDNGNSMDKMIDALKSDSSMKAEACSKRRQILGSIYSVRFSALLKSIHKDTAETFNSHDSCMERFTQDDFTNLCVHGSTEEPGGTTVEDQVETAVDDRLKFYFESVQSPLYSTFFEKKDIANKFLADTGTLISSLNAEVGALQTDLTTTTAEFCSAIEPVEAEFNRYIRFNEHALELSDTIKVLASGSMSQDVGVKVNDALAIVEPLIISLEAEAKAVEGLKAAIDPALVRTEALKACQTYFCAIKGSLAMDTQPGGGGSLPPSTLCDSPSFGLENNSVCTGKVGSMVPVDVKTFCVNKATELENPISSFFKENLTPQEAFNCLNTSI